MAHKKLKTNFRLRRDYSKINKIVEIPNLLKLQKESYHKFLQFIVDPDKREDFGLEAVFKDIFPIKDHSETVTLEYVSYSLDTPKYDVEECRQRGMTWSAPLRVKVQLVLWDKDPETGVRNLSALKEDTVYFGEIPLMTENATFVVNGTERVVVSQLHRSPGIFFTNDKGKKHISGKILYSARIIPYSQRGSWMDFEFDAKDILHVKIDTRRKFSSTIVLRAIGMDADQILDYYYKKEEIKFEKRGVVTKKFIPDQIEGQRIFKDIKVNNKVIAKAGAKFNRAVVRRIKDAGIEDIFIDPDSLIGMVSADTIIVATEDIINPLTEKKVLSAGTSVVGWKKICKKLKPVIEELEEEDCRKLFEAIAVVVYAGEELIADKISTKGKVLNAGNLSQLRDLGLTKLNTLYLDDRHIGESLLKTLNNDKMSPERDDLYSRVISKPCDDSLIEIYRRIRPGDPPRIETARATFRNMFFNPDKYDLSEIGRYKINHKLYVPHGLEAPTLDTRILLESDIKQTVSYLLNLKNSTDSSKYTLDDIDHLGNRRVRAVGELVENQFRTGLVRLERTVREKMGMQDIDTLVPQDLINYRPVAAVLKEFFGSSQLSQFMDQTNPLSEITHKRRLSALGPGGLSRERAGFEVRDVNTTHYGRICPIETPEGPNIGLISSLAVYARVNPYGFLETPYRIVNDKNKVTEDIEHLTALQEERETIAQASVDTDKSGKFLNPTVSCRKNGEYVNVEPELVSKVDVSPKQIVSVAASLIPFLENDDANRALMGSNMQRQAVPCLKASAPLVGTGMEEVVARDSGATITADRAGTVVSVDAERIVIKADKLSGNKGDSGVDIYKVTKYKRSNQDTCINQRPIIRPGEKVKAGEVIADGPSTDMAELALGQNILVAFMPWNGYNFEDSILINENLVKDDIFTSVHIDSHECIARDTKLGAEEITSDIPNVSEDHLRNLDESGIIKVGTEVKSGDILVGKITPKSETQLSPEEKLLRAIFGEKAGEVRDTSLRLSPGNTGTVIGTHIYSRKGIEKDERGLQLEKREIKAVEKDYKEEMKVIKDIAYSDLDKFLSGKKTSTKLVDKKKKEIFAKGAVLNLEIIKDANFESLKDIQIGDEKIEGKIKELVVKTNEMLSLKRSELKDKITKIKEGDELAPGVIKMVKVFVAQKRKIQVGDKIAGRHGNKGVLSRVVAQEDMPFMEDGTPVDIVLNPLGVPSRMNVGQILETHLGLAAWKLGKNLWQTLDKTVDPRTGSFRSGFSAEDRTKTANELRDTLKGAYGEDSFKEQMGDLSDKDIFEYSRKQYDGIRVSTPVFDAAKEESIKDLLEFSGLDRSGQMTLFDGRTGESFNEKITVGVMYMLKLDHLVENKIHARSTGPYSLVTQQPLGGKAQFGGQRLGEMEVWALEAYGAAYTLQECLTVKSDDVIGRNRMYESIVKGDHKFEPGVPESFNVLVNELKALALKVDLIDTNAVDTSATSETETKAVNTANIKF